MRVAFCWTEANAYMAACWRALAARRDLELLVIAGKPGAFVPTNLYDESIMAGLHSVLLDRPACFDRDLIESTLCEFKPDIVFIPGWWNPAFVRLAYCSSLSNARFILGFDTVMDRSLGQYRERLRAGGLVKRVDLIVVPGERGKQYAIRVLGAPEEKIRDSLYGMDWDLASQAWQQRRRGEWPRYFLFVGSYTERKGFDLLLEAYHRYRRAVSDPWPLTCAGAGPLQARVKQVKGVVDVGFVQPCHQPNLFGSHGVFVLPSRNDAWPLALVEAGASGLPVICSAACGSAVEVVRHQYNGWLLPCVDVTRIQLALIDAHLRADDLPQMGERSRQLAAPFSHENWALRWWSYLQELA